MAMMRGVDFSWGALPHNGAFATTDGALVVVGAFKENPLREISLAIGLDDLSADPRFCSFALSMQNRTALHDILRAHFATNTTAHWIAALEARDLLCAPVRSLPVALDDPQTGINGMKLVAPQDSGDELRVVGSPVHLSDDGFALRMPPPRVGAHGARNPGRAWLRCRNDRRAARGRRAGMTVRLDIADHVARVTVDRPAGAERARCRGDPGTGSHLAAAGSGSRRACRGADWRRRARLLRRRRHALGRCRHGPRQDRYRQARHGQARHGQGGEEPHRPRPIGRMRIPPASADCRCAPRSTSRSLRGSTATRWVAGWR